MPQKEHVKGAPAKVNQLYERIKKKQPDQSDEYCARVAWQVYCSHVNPDYKGCTPAGKGPELAGPISSKVEKTPCQCRHEKKVRANKDIATALRAVANALENMD